MIRVSIALLLVVGLVVGWLATNLQVENPRELPGDVSLSGADTVLQQAYDVQRYDVSFKVDPSKKWISGETVVHFKALETLSVLELDLDTVLAVTEATAGGSALGVERVGGKVRILLSEAMKADEQGSVRVAFEGHPHVAENAPWDGGFVWAQTPAGEPWIATAVQGDGCDLFWACKDSFKDDPDTMSITVTVPEGLVAATNGVLESVEGQAGWKSYRWSVRNPVNPYVVALNIAPYEVIERAYPGINGTEIPLEFYALPGSMEQAETLVDKTLLPMIAFFERKVGPYPWGNEKLGFAETPHLGMEHQTINAYGNKFRADPLGFDWLLHHELAHEWFGNLLTHAEGRDWWLHEGFARYMESVYAGEVIGEAAYNYHMYSDLQRIQNCNPLVPDDLKPGLLPEQHDVYYKGEWVLHTLRTYLGDEVFWRAVRRLLYGTSEPWSLQYPITPVYGVTQEFIAILEEESGRTLDWFFEAYTEVRSVPELTVERQSDGSAHIRWIVDGGKPFPLPVTVLVDGEERLLDMTDGSEVLNVGPNATIQLDPNLAVLRKTSFMQTCDG